VETTVETPAPETPRPPVVEPRPAVLPPDDSHRDDRRRRPRDDWDDRYEDEYEYLEEECWTRHEFDSEAA
jgi:hypothetical protein